MTRTLRRLATIALVVFSLPAFAQDIPQIDVVGGRAAALPIAVVPFAGSAGDTDIAKVIAADFERSGQFRTLPAADMVERPTTAAQVNYPTWRALKQDYLLIGRIDNSGGQLRVEYELFDIAKQQRVLGQVMTLPATGARDLSHQLADAVYEKILGVRGAFWTRIAYITAVGTAPRGEPEPATRGLTPCRTRAQAASGISSCSPCGRRATMLVPSMAAMRSKARSSSHGGRPGLKSGLVTPSVTRRWSSTIPAGSTSTASERSVLAIAWAWWAQWSMASRLTGTGATRSIRAASRNRSSAPARRSLLVTPTSSAARWATSGAWTCRKPATMMSS